MRSRKEKAAEAEVEQQLVQAVIDRVEAEIPDMMVEREIDEMINAFEMQLRDQGMNLEAFLKYTQGTVDSLREQYKDRAEKQVRVRLGLSQIAAQEHLEITDEEVEEEFKKIGDAYGVPLENVKGLIREKDVRKDIANQKAVDFIKANAVITEKQSGGEEAQE